MTALVISTALAIVGGVVFALAVVAVRHYPSIGLGSVGLIVVTIWEVPYPPAILTLSGLTIYPADIITLVLFLVGIIEAAQIRMNLRGWFYPWLFFGMLIAVSTLRGIAAFGPGTALNEARSLLFFFFTMTWVFAMRPERLRLHTFSFVLGWALVLIGIYHGVEYGIGNALSSAEFADGEFHTGRILVSGQAEALLLCAGLVYLGSARSGQARQWSVFSSIVFLVVVFLAQHRSVWVSSALGVAAVMLWSGSKRARQQALVVAVLGAWIALVAWASGIFEGSELIDSASDTATLDWRTASWQSLISQAFGGGLEVIVGGEPFGSGFVRQLGKGWTAVTPHNWYVTVLLRVGAVGLIVIAVLLVSALARSRGLRPEWTFLLMAAGAYAFAYTLDWYLAPWLGAAMGASLGGSPEEPIGSDWEKRRATARNTPEGSSPLPSDRLKSRGRFNLDRGSRR